MHLLHLIIDIIVHRGGTNVEDVDHIVHSAVSVIKCEEETKENQQVHLSMRKELSRLADVK
jgi:hypothetical protein